jgi:hypothetical protein
MPWGHFSTAHIISLILVVVVGVFGYFFLRKKSEKVQKYCMIGLSMPGIFAIIYNLIAYGNPIEYLPEITNSSSQIYNSAGTHSTLSEFLAIKPPSKAPAPTTIKPVPKVVPTIPTVAAAPINPPAPPTTSGESSLDNFSICL